MKIKIFDTQTVSNNNRYAYPTINISFKCGTFNINKSACVRMGIEEGCTLSIVQDQEKPRDWYILKSETGFKFRKNSSNVGIVANIKEVAIKFYESLELHESKRFPIAKEPVILDGMELWAIITASVKK